MQGERGSNQELLAKLSVDRGDEARRCRRRDRRDVTDVLRGHPLDQPQHDTHVPSPLRLARASPRMTRRPMLAATTSITRTSKAGTTTRGARRSAVDPTALTASPRYTVIAVQGTIPTAVPST